MVWIFHSNRACESVTNAKHKSAAFITLSKKKFSFKCVLIRIDLNKSYLVKAIEFNKLMNCVAIYSSL